MTTVFIKSTLIISLLCQFIIGLLNIWALQWKVQPQGQWIRYLLIIELGIQIIEFFMYLILTWIFWSYKHQAWPISPMTLRYFDWSITTPSMLFTLMAFLSRIPSLSQFWKRYSQSVIFVWIMNALMLYCGYQSERLDVHQRRHKRRHRHRHRHNRHFCVLEQRKKLVYQGFIPFFFMFFWIAYVFQSSLRQSSFHRFLFFWFFVLWTGYGILAFTSFSIRNSGYNLLDVFSKNITSLFLIQHLRQYIVVSPRLRLSLPSTKQKEEQKKILIPQNQASSPKDKNVSTSIREVSSPSLFRTGWKSKK